MNAVFADTYFYQALLDERDSAHANALAYSKLSRTIATTEFVLLELGNACARAEDHADFLALLAGLRASPRTRVVPLDSGLLQRGLDLFAARPDKDWSLTDCTSFVVMQDQGLTEALTADSHFLQAGFKALLI
ncbi:MAG TPA: PIN domain-containing protein [Candidatus Acidoferrum sp.]|nr:PIN domain-containing protein [Candidatus Acidoferrum sp.]